jgi:hypothetical protein
VQAAWVVLVRIKNWERYGLKSWIEAAKRRLHHNVLAIALANKLARIAWAVLAKGRGFELTRTSSNPLDPRAVLGAVKAQPGNAGARRKPSATAGLDRPCARRDRRLQAGTKERPLARTKELGDMRSKR